MNLLVAIDGSQEAEDALAYAIDVAEAMDGSVTTVYAVDPAVYEEGGSEPISTFADADGRLVVESVQDAEERGQRVFDDAIEFAEQRDFDIETELLYGSPVTAITDYAEAEDLDTIYVGHRGRSERMELLVGSVAKGVVERATVPVTVVR